MPQKGLKSYTPSREYCTYLAHTACKQSRLALPPPSYTWCTQTHADMPTVHCATPCLDWGHAARKVKVILDNLIWPFALSQPLPHVLPNSAQREQGLCCVTVSIAVMSNVKFGSEVTDTSFSHGSTIDLNFRRRGFTV